MSDTEDQLILEDIRALEDALSRKSTTHSIPAGSLKTELAPCIVHPDPDEAETVSQLPLDSEPVSTNNEENLIADSATALKLNQALIERLIASRDEVAAILEECKKKRAVVNQKIKKRLRVLPNTRKLSSHAGMPYFKDKDFFSAPPNEDTKLKEARGELQIIHLRRVSRWTAKDKDILLKAIHHEVLGSLKNLNEEEENEVEKMPLGKIHSLPNVVTKAIGPLGTREFDWMKIAVTDFQNKHSPEECRVMWNVFLHPEINKFKWKKKELTDLVKLVKKYKNENWDAIARELGTQRSGYQCFVKYNTIKKVQTNDKPWTKQEDKKVFQLVNKFKIGDFINWGDVASCMKTRTKQQIYFRWTYSLAPHLKKGRFTEEEDKLLIDAIEKYGLNFKKISALVLPARTSAQLSDHYNTITNKEENVWTIEQDAKLIELYNKYGNDWAKIATFFESKDRVQLRHRRAALSRYEKRGIALNQIPRNQPKDQVEVVVFHKIPVNTGVRADLNNKLDDADKKIIEYFKNVNTGPSKVGRVKKFYTGKELESTTWKLYNILQLMSVNLKIPYDLDEYDCLTEKDKQLLNSLKNLPHEVTHGSFSRKVEQLRVEMFESNRDSEEEDDTGDTHFIPPLPFGCYLRTNKTNPIINYSVYVENSFLVEREFTLETPANVTQALGNDMEATFDKLSRLLVSPDHKSEKQPAFQSIYILTPEDITNREMKKREIRQVQEKFQPLPSTSRSSQSEVNILGSYNNRSVTINEMDMNNLSAMKPSFATLVGFQGILNAKRSMDTGNERNENFETSRKIQEKGRVALDLLRTRLIQLFKYPIVMSQVMPPETFDEHGSIFLTQEKKPSETLAGPSRKKRRIATELE